jgi:acyl-CoA dehydrogenase
MDFSFSDRETYFRDRVRDFIDQNIRPRQADYDAQAHHGERWKVIPVIEEMKEKAKAAGLWNFFMPPHSGQTHVDDSFVFEGTQLTNLEYALCAEEMGKVSWASECFNCSAPDTGNMEVFHRYGTREQKEAWLGPLMRGEVRSAFLMTEPAVASSDATNIETSMVRDGDHYVINGTKWWSSGVGDPRCKIAIVMGKTSFEGSRHQQQSQILVPMDTPGVTIKRMLSVYGYDHAPHGHGEVVLENVPVPVENVLLGEGRGFEIAQGRLGPGRIHHRGDGETTAEPCRVRQADRRLLGLGGADRDRADRYRDDAAAVPQGRGHDGQGGQQIRTDRDLDDQGRRAEHGAEDPRRCDPGAWWWWRVGRLPARARLGGNADAALRRWSRRGPQPIDRAQRVRQIRGFSQRRRVERGCRGEPLTLSRSS